MGGRPVSSNHVSSRRIKGRRIVGRRIVGRRIVGRCILSAFAGLIWMLLFSSFTLPCFVAGFLVGLGCTLLFDLIAGRVGAKSAGADSGRTGERFSDVSEVHATSDFKSGLRMTPWMISLFFVFLWELLKANWAVLVTAFRPKLGIEPGIIALPIDLDSDLKIMLLANMITLTPGTISVEISNDNRFIYVHALDCSDPQGVIDGIDKAFTRRLKGVKWHDFNVS